MKNHCTPNTPEDPFYGFNEEERLHIGYYTNFSLSSETFYAARKLADENPELFEEKFHIKAPVKTEEAVG